MFRYWVRVVVSMHAYFFQRLLTTLLSLHSLEARWLAVLRRVRLDTDTKAAAAAGLLYESTTTRCVWNNIRLLAYREDLENGQSVPIGWMRACVAMLHCLEFRSCMYKQQYCSTTTQQQNVDQNNNSWHVYMYFELKFKMIYHTQSSRVPPSATNYYRTEEKEITN